jgi:endonuclease/exonuclease/phosphatase family metal-dependent hydrolase
MIERKQDAAIWAAFLAAGVVLGYLAFHRAPSVPPAPAAAVEQKWDPANFKSTMTIATYNVKNFFDEYDNPYTADEGTAKKPEAEVKALTEAIAKVNADVLILQEVEADGVLKKFAEGPLAEMKYSYVVDTTTEDARGITVAALSRFPVQRITSHRLALLDEAAAASAENRFARDLLRIDVEPKPGFVISVYGVHLKSKRTDPDSKDKQSNGKRLAEGKRIREIIKSEQPAGARFIFVGDCNDYIDTPPLKEIRAATEPMLTDALEKIPADKRITFKNERYTEAIDQILLSPALAADLVENSAEIFSGEPFTKASDHRPVRVTVRVP